MTDAVVVMAKAPRPGTVKTRLQPLLGPDRCAALQAALTRHMLATAAARYTTYLALTPPTAIAGTSDLPRTVRVLAQRGADLGERMANAAAAALQHSHSRVVIVGTDTPQIDTDRLATAFTALDDHDVVIGPALDGGYYLIGLGHLDRSLFALPPSAWGGPDVLELTVRRARTASRSVRLLDVDRDLDTPADAAALRDDPRVPASVRQLLPPAVARTTVPA